MKTFDEAIKIVCIADSRNSDHCMAVADQQIKSMSMIKEVCDSPEAHFVATALMKMIPEDPSIEEFRICIMNAIAQGVLIGMEMEKIDPTDFRSAEE